MTDNKGPEDSKGPEYEKGNAFKANLIRIVTVFAYASSVSMAAMVLSSYYVFFWEPKPPSPDPPIIRAHARVDPLPPQRLISAHETDSDSLWESVWSYFDSKDTTTTSLPTTFPTQVPNILPDCIVKNPSSQDVPSHSTNILDQETSTDSSTDSSKINRLEVRSLINKIIKNGTKNLPNKIEEIQSPSTNILDQETNTESLIDSSKLSTKQVQNLINKINNETKIILNKIEDIQSISTKNILAQEVQSQSTNILHQENSTKTSTESSKIQVQGLPHNTIYNGTQILLNKITTMISRPDFQNLTSITSNV